MDKVLKQKAWEHKRIAEFAVEDELYEQAIQNYNFALEMLMKAALIKDGCNPPNSHDLLAISNTKNPGNVKILRRAINSTRFIKPLWDKIHSIWDTNMRYQFLNLGEEDYLDYIDAYERVYGWIESRFF